MAHNARKQEELQRQRDKLQHFASPGYLRSHPPGAMSPDALITNLMAASTKSQVRHPEANTANHYTQSSANVKQHAELSGAYYCQKVGGSLLTSCLDESRIPDEYRRALAAVSAGGVNAYPNTAAVYNLMLTSGLPKDVLGHVWSVVNRTVPGQLTQAEFYAALALIAQVQNGSPPSIELLNHESILPIPKLKLPPLSTPNVTPSHSVPSASTQVAPKPVRVADSKNGSKTAPHEVASSAMNDLSDLDLGALNAAPTSMPQSKHIGVPPTTSASAPQPNLVDYLSPLEPISVGSSNSPADSNSLKEPSLHSLDLKAGKLDDEISGSDDLVKGVLQPESLVCSPIIHDKYAILKDQLDGCNSQPETASDVWLRCLQVIESIISEACTLLHDTPAEVMSQVLQTEKGQQYVVSLCRTYKVAMRIRKSAAINRGSEMEIEGLLTSIMKSWQQLKNSSKYFCEEVDDEAEGDGGGGGSGDAASAECGVCRRSGGRRVAFAGRSYHSQCANLWINAVSPLLPSS